MVGTRVDGQSLSVDVMEFIRPDGLVDIAKLGLTLAEGKRPLAQVQPSGKLEKRRLKRRLPQRKCRNSVISATMGKAATMQANARARGQPPRCNDAPEPDEPRQEQSDAAAGVGPGGVALIRNADQLHETSRSY